MSRDRIPDQPLPRHFALLSPSNQLQYKELAIRLQSRSNRYNRNQRLAKFRDSMKAIRAFCVRSDESDWIRSVVCGVYWASDHLCLNPSQACLLLGKSKSSINSALAELGCQTISAKESEIMALLPFLDRDSTEWRQWSVRQSLVLEEEESVPSTGESEAIEGQECQDPFLAPFHDCNCGCTCMAPDQFAGVHCRCALPGESEEFGTPCNCGCRLAMNTADESDG
jgi:hypothetical protein